MKVLMVTNTYAPIVGGVEKSITTFTEGLRSQGHRVVIVAPDFPDAQEEEDVIRIPSIQQFNNTDWSVNLPLTGELERFVEEFQPDIVHSHHPFLLGDVAVRLCSKYKLPLVFTYHTMYEDYTHYLPIQNDLIKRFIIELTAGYANMANQVIAPSESLHTVLLDRGVEAPIKVIPTGIDIHQLEHGDGSAFRKNWQIPQEAYVLGHVGRLAPEKNLDFLARSVVQFMKSYSKVYFLVIGEGSSQKEIKKLFEKEGCLPRLILTNTLKGQDLTDGYHAMDLFVFASQTETQGLVLTEAMAAGLPIVAVDAPGARDVVEDKVNGRMIPHADEDTFFAAIEWCHEASKAKKKSLIESARKTAGKFSKERCLEDLLAVYNTAKKEQFPTDAKHRHIWHNLKHRLDAEWDLLKNMLDAGEAAIVKKMIDDRFLVKSHMEPFLVKVRRFFNRNEWMRKLLGLTIEEDTENKPGLIMIQIDGFSMTQFKRALKHDEMPFLQRLIEKDHYKMYPLYPGLPSSTPSIQAELFYGTKQAVPAFSFFDEKSKKVLTMYDGDSAKLMEERLKKENKGLLEGGSSYSNVYSGGAKEAHFCATSLGFHDLWRNAKPFKIAVVLLTNFITIIYAVFLIALELVLAVVDFFIGLCKGENFWKEFKFIPTRAVICILLRELITLGARVDIVRGLPIIHMNFIGYDEQAHRRGPYSRFAHRALKGIDVVIARIYREALYSIRRNYDIWIYSDHGQEESKSYIEEYGETVKQATAEIFKEFDLKTKHEEEERGVQHQRARYLGKPFFQKIFSFGFQKENREEDVIVTAIGPTGNIYLPRALNWDEKNYFVQRLIHKAKIPMVFSCDQEKTVYGWNHAGRYRLPEDAAILFGADHPYLEEITKDMIRLTRHSNSGDFCFCGWQPGEKPLTFPVESGAHAGFGEEETNAFALLPSDIEALPFGKSYLKVRDIRRAALKHLNRRVLEKEEKESDPSVSRVSDKKTIRLMTYNTHSSIGLDGKISPERIARVIGRHQPDIVALQELDMSRMRTRGIDQPHHIAKYLEMMYHFHPVIRVEEEQYGNAILTKFPIQLVQAKRLPPFSENWKGEPRGALWVCMDIGEKKLNFINTHLGLSKKERREQAQMLVSADWLGHPDCRDYVVVAGDFNAPPNSYVCKKIGERLKDAQKSLQGHKPKTTWMSFRPTRRIDHVFISEKIKVRRVQVSKTELDKVASDHLPLIIDIELLD